MTTRLAPAAPSNDLGLCAPKFANAVRTAIANLNARGWDAVVFEALRSEELQAWDFEHGSSNAEHVWHSWHGYGLAVDVTSRQHGWDLWGRSTPTAWQVAVVAEMKAQGLAWGGDWQHGVGPTHAVDWDHFQFGTLKKSPSIISITLFQSAPDGYKAVWPIVHAL